MKRKSIAFPLLFPVLCCLMGADTIDWAKDYPIANPGGLADTVAGKGTFGTEKGNNFSAVYFWRKNNAGTETPAQATTAGNNWDKTLTVAAGTYTVW